MLVRWPVVMRVMPPASGPSSSTTTCLPAFTRWYAVLRPAMPAPMITASACTFSCSGAHSGICAVADQTDSWRGMALSCFGRATCNKRSLSLLLRPPAAELLVDGGRGVQLRQRALFLRLLLPLPFGHQRVGLGEGLLEGMRGGQGFLEVGAAEPGEVGLVGAAEGGAVVARGGDHHGGAVLERLDEAARVAGRHDDHLVLDAALAHQAAEL